MASRPCRTWCKPAVSEDDEAGVDKRKRLWCQLDIEDDGAPGDVAPRQCPQGWRQPALDECAPTPEDRPTPAFPAACTSVSLNATTLLFLGNLPMKEKLNSYDKNGMCQQRIQAALQHCSCRDVCVRQFGLQEIQDLCHMYHRIHENDRQKVLHTMYTGDTAMGDPCPPSSGGISLATPFPHSVGTRQSWNLLGRKICVTGFCALLGVSCRTLYKDIKFAVDGRRKLDEEGPMHSRATPQADVVHHFFRHLYASAAEALPTAPRVDDGASMSSMSEDEQDSLAGWTPDRPLLDIVGDSIGDMDPARLPARQLPLYSMADLYWQFEAWFESLEPAAEEGADAHEAQIPSRRVFARVWRETWSTVLRLKYPSDHSYCQTCFEFRQRIYNTWAPVQTKLQYARLWRDHLRGQYLDRQLYWSLRFLSRRFDSTVLTIIIDTMDRRKAPWPKWDFNRKPHQIAQLPPRPRMIITGGIAHGWCTAVFIAPETLSHGSNAYIEVLCQILNEVAERCRTQGKRFPVHLVLQADNTVAQTKNQYASAFCAQLVGMGKFCSVGLNFLMVGHTHEDIDQLFSIICQYVMRRHRWQTPEEFQRILQETLAPRIAERAEVLVVRHLRLIRDYVRWLDPQMVTLYNCWGNRDGFEAPHSFAFKMRDDLTASELGQVRGQRAHGFADDPADVFCCVKTYMRDKRLMQQPVLVLPQTRCARVYGRPAHIEAVRMTDVRAEQLETIATVVARADYGYHLAARALRDLARTRAPPPLPAPGWLEEPPVELPPVVDVGNEYFNHLPDISWHMRARFHRI